VQLEIFEHQHRAVLVAYGAFSYPSPYVRIQTLFPRSRGIALPFLTRSTAVPLRWRCLESAHRCYSAPAYLQHGQGPGPTQALASAIAPCRCRGAFASSKRRSLSSRASLLSLLRTVPVIAVEGTLCGPHHFQSVAQMAINRLECGGGNQSVLADIRAASPRTSQQHRVERRPFIQALD
jgi:hypothetical protein